jgi:hypothetical protein
MQPQSYENECRAAILDKARTAQAGESAGISVLIKLAECN